MLTVDEGSAAVRLARRALDITLEYTKERKQFGQRICDLPVARDMIVQCGKKSSSLNWHS